MIVIEDIKIGDIVKILVMNEDVEEELYARIVDNQIRQLVVKYLVPTNKIYKGACVLELDETEELTDPECLTAHFIEDEDELFYIKDNLYVVDEEINPEEDSEIFEDDEDEEDEYDSEDSFIAPDDQVDGLVIPPPNHQEIDREWNSWSPSSPGAHRFKEMVNAIEQHARVHADTLNF